MNGDAFKGVFAFIFTIGIVAGICLVGAVYGVYELISHLHWQ